MKPVVKCFVYEPQKQSHFLILVKNRLKKKTSSPSSVEYHSSCMQQHFDTDYETDNNRNPTSYRQKLQFSCFKF